MLVTSPNTHSAPAKSSAVIVCFLEGCRPGGAGERARARGRERGRA